MPGLTYLSGAQQAVEGFARVSYPQQLRILLGIAKPLGAIALLIPGWPRLKEWAYAGFTLCLDRGCPGALSGARNFECNHSAGALGNLDRLLFHSPRKSPSTGTNCGVRISRFTS
jgi:hypothetical protein